MKKVIRTVAVLLLLGTLTTGCQKEPLVEPSTTLMVITPVYSVGYSVDGISQTATLYGDESALQFLQDLCALARQGSVVSVGSDMNNRCVSTKETITFSTKDQDEMAEWMLKMISLGYMVTVEYDELTGYYNGTAVK